MDSCCMYSMKNMSLAYLERPHGSTEKRVYAIGTPRLSCQPGKATVQDENHALTWVRRAKDVRWVQGMELTMHPLLLLFDLLATNEQSSTEFMLFANLAELIKDLQSQLSGWGNDQSSKTVQGTPFEPVQLL